MATMSACLTSKVRTSTCNRMNLILTQLFSVTDKETIKRWLVSGSIKKAYDRSVKGYVYITDLSSKLQLPKDPRR